MGVGVGVGGASWCVRLCVCVGVETPIFVSCIEANVLINLKAFLISHTRSVASYPEHSLFRESLRPRNSSRNTTPPLEKTQQSQPNFDLAFGAGRDAKKAAGEKKGAVSFNQKVRECVCVYFFRVICSFSPFSQIPPFFQRFGPWGCVVLRFGLNSLFHF